MSIFLNGRGKSAAGSAANKQLFSLCMRAMRPCPVFVHRAAECHSAGPLRQHSEILPKLSQQSLTSLQVQQLRDDHGEVGPGSGP